MTKVNVLILQKYLDAVTTALGHAGLIHLVDAVRQTRLQLLDEVDCADDIQDVESLERKCEYLMTTLAIRPSAESTALPSSMDREDIRRLLESVEKECIQEQDALDELMSESGSLLRQNEALRGYPFRKLRVGDVADLDFLYFKTGRLAPPNVEAMARALGDRALIMHERDNRRHEEHVLVFAPRKNRWAIEAELKKVGFKEEELLGEGEETVAEKLGRLQSRLTDVGRAIEEHKRNITGLAERYGKRLAAAQICLQQTLALDRAKQHFGKTSDLFCVSGWIPAERKEELGSLVSNVTHGTAVVECITPEQDEFVGEGEEQVPVMFADNSLLRPFQRLVAAFGIPRYQEVEPSLFVALSFVLMFGLMFGDVGQGMVIAAAGWWLLKTKRAALQPFKDIGYLLIFCGGAAVVFGFLYGSVFGYEGLLPQLWIRPLHDVLILLEVAVAVGVCCISVGIILNIINKIRSRNYLEGVLDKFGVIGIVFYWGAIGLGLKALVAGTISVWEVLVVIVLPLCIIFMREPLINLLRHKRKLLHEDVFSFLMESAVEVMETVTVFLGSTVSFVRVGAFALSHAALCLAIYAVAQAISGMPAGGLWVGLVVVFGNVVVILLEGMVVGIQGIRLQYYELFSKYFAGDGVLYSPFHSRGSSK